MMYSKLCLSSRETVPLKGPWHEIFEVGVFRQTTPPGAIRGFLKPFLILGTFSRSFKTTPWRPGYQVVANFRCPNIQQRGVENFLCPGHQGVKKFPVSRYYYRVPTHNNTTIA